MEKDNGPAQPQLYGTSYFSVRNALTGPFRESLTMLRRLDCKHTPVAASSSSLFRWMRDHQFKLGEEYSFVE